MKKRIFPTVIILILIRAFWFLTEEIRQENDFQVFCDDGYTALLHDNRAHSRNWNSNFESHCLHYISENKKNKEQRALRESRSGIGIEYHKWWGALYKQLVNDNKSEIRFLIDSIESIAQKRKLKSVEYAEMIVALVQDIPYSSILQENCDSVSNKDTPCVGNIPLGILSPYEFIHTLAGDCDTRAVLLYCLLSEMNFDPIIVISKEYAHAMIALNIPATGDHITFAGKKYYFWETTSKNWPIGMLPPNAKNVSYWKVALSQDLQKT